MIRKIPFRLALKTMIGLIILVFIYHSLILSETIPFDAVWGGRLESRRQMQTFEIASIVINLFILCVILIKGRLLKIPIPLSVVTFLLWVFVVLYTLNTVGNVFSNSRLEAFLFTPLTFLSAIMCARLAVETSSSTSGD